MTKFRPQLFQFEARDVPAFASFMMPDTTIGSAFFSTPEGVDPAQASQVFSIDDLEVIKAGDRYVTLEGASAEYAYGVLVGLTAHAVGDYDEFDFSGSTVQVDEATAPLAFDGATTQITFDLPDRTTGALSYDIPWDQVDSDQASQSLTPTAFNLNIAGANFAYGSANYTQPPTLHFAYGEFVGVSFELTPTAGFTYTSIGASFDVNGDNIITAIQAGTGLQLIAAPTVKTTALAFDFSDCDTAGYTYELTITVSYVGGAPDKSVTITVEENTTKGGLRDIIFLALKNEGVKVTTFGDYRLGVEGTEKNPMSFVKFQATKPPIELQDPSVKGVFQAGQIKTKDLDPNWTVKVVAP